ncbi:MAG: hypothetical protein NZ518_01760, partial [Dehalococcoidia bacterium]|nr:hypothetical protein [Dehalococcoidia bacterium]
MTLTVPPPSDPALTSAPGFTDSVASLRLDAISPRVGRLVPLEFAEHWRVAPVEQTAFDVVIAAARPLPHGVVAQLERFVGAKVRIVRSTHREIRDALARIWRLPPRAAPAESVGEWLTVLGFASEEQVRWAVATQRDTGASLSVILQTEAGVDEERWNQALGLSLELPTLAIERLN